MNQYQLFSMADDLTPYVPCQRRSNMRSQRAFFPFAKQFQVSSRSGESIKNDDENFFVEGLFTPIGNSSHFDCKLESLAEPDRLQAQFDQNSSLPGVMSEQCFAELIKSSLKLPSLNSRENPPVISDPLRLLECSNSENNNSSGSYCDSGFYDCGKEMSAENANHSVTAIGERSKNDHYVNNASKLTTDSFDNCKLPSQEHSKIAAQNFSNQVLPTDTSITDCSRMSTRLSQNVARTNHPILDCLNCQPDAEDLEVAMINESFEEQQKQSKIIEDAVMKSLLYAQAKKKSAGNGGTSIDGKVGNISHGVKDTDSGSVHRASEGNVASVVCERMPYTATIAANSKKQLTFNKHIGDETSSVSSGCAGSVFEDAFDRKLSDFDVEEMILDDAALRRAAECLSSGRYNITEHLQEVPLTESRRDFVKAKKKRSSSDAIPINDQKQVLTQMGSADEKLDATAAIAYNVVESLFVGGNSLDHLSPLSHSSTKETQEGSMKSGCAVSEEKGADKSDGALAPAVQSVFDAYRLSMKQSNQSDCISPDVDSEILKAIKESKSTTSSPLRKIDESSSTAATSCDSAVDSWEELDRDDSKLDEIQSAMGKVKIRKPKIDYFTSPETIVAGWDEKDLPNVLEAYDLPPRRSYDDIKYELAKLDCADVTFQKVDDSHCLISFSSANAALKALIATRQRSACPWLRLRSMCDASVAGKEKARSRSTSLKPYKPRPQTTMVVARRLVENALGKRSNVSAEQRRAERKRLNEAKVLKDAKTAIWEDIS